MYQVCNCDKSFGRSPCPIHEKSPEATTVSTYPIDPRDGGCIKTKEGYIYIANPLWVCIVERDSR